MSTIELGEIPTASGGHPAPAGSPRFDRRLARQAGAGAVGVLCAVTLAGSVVPQPAGLRPLWNVSAAQIQSTALSRDGVFVHRSINGAAAVTAYDLATGAIRWERAFDNTIGYLQVAEAAGMLLIPAQGRVVELPSVNDGSAFHAEFHQLTIAVSMATGAELWRTAGEPFTADGETVLLTEYTQRADLARMRLVRLSDHTTIWSRDTPGVSNQTVVETDARPDKIITASDDGDIKIYGYASGALVSAARIPWVESRPEEGYFNDLSGTGEVLVVNRSRAESFQMSVYLMSTMAELWRAADTSGYAFPCGSSLCLNDGRGVVAYDATSGSRRWRIDGVDNAWEVAPDRLIVGEGAEDGRQLLVDAATGRTVGEPAEGTVAWSDPRGRSIILLRSTQSPPDRTAVTRWDLRTGRQWVLGTIAPMPGRPCSAVAGYLTCARGDVYEVLAVG